MILSLALFSLASTLLFVLLHDGFKKWRVVNARFASQQRLTRAMQWLKNDLEKADPNQLSHKRITTTPGQGDAVWFLSAEDPSAAVDRRMLRDTATGAPLWQRQIMYYLIRPGNYAKVSGGYNAGIDPDPRNDYYAPHKFLLRKVINQASDPETLLGTAAADAFITAPSDYNLATLSSEAQVESCRLIADRMLSFEVTRYDRTLELDLRTVHIENAERVERVGSVSLKDSKFTQHQRMRVVMRQ